MKSKWNKNQEQNRGSRSYGQRKANHQALPAEPDQSVGGKAAIFCLLRRPVVQALTKEILKSSVLGPPADDFRHLFGKPTTLVYSPFSPA